MVSQIVNLSNQKTFKHFKEKYNCQDLFSRGVYGIELRNVPAELYNFELTENQKIFFKNRNIFFIGSFNEIIDSLNEAKLNREIKSAVADVINKYNNNDKIAYTFGNRTFNFNNSYVMGILNVTPDSFSDAGIHFNQVDAVNYASKMLAAGADIIDIGGESTRPGSESVAANEEVDRVVPVISAIKERYPEAIISIDTTKASVAKASLLKGAAIINDISGGTFDKEMLNVVKQYDAAIIIMHIKGKPKTMQENPEYEDVVSEVYDFLFHQSEAAKKEGISKILIDPGIGFGKSTEHNLTLIERLEDFKSLGYPILIGVSRKSFIGKILNLPVEERDSSTNALNALAISHGARVIRTHNVRYAVETCTIFNSIVSN